ncbi:MAG: N-acetylmuramoyl-L-alanine amidase [Thermoleophilia bacterium]
MWASAQHPVCTIIAVCGAVLCLALAMLFMTCPSPAAAQSTAFSDVNEEMVAYDAIRFMAGAGVISGYSDGSFRPSNTLTRGQATKVLVLWQRVPLTKAAGYSFSDVDSVYRPYVSAAVAQRWVGGYADGLFRPYSTLTRQQMAVIMVRALGWDTQARNLSSASVQKTLAAFSDSRDIASNARAYVALAVDRGLFGGSNGRFLPNSGITRAQFTLVVFRADLSQCAVIQRVRFSSDYDDKTRVVFDLSRAPGKITSAVTADGNLTVDYTGGALAAPMSQAIGSPEVASVDARQYAYNPRTVRVTLNLTSYRTFKVMSLAPSGDNSCHRIVVDLYRCVAETPKRDGPPLICIDPGHGGSASGAIGVSGSLEKDINLDIAKFVAADLRAAGLEVLMTRDDDRFVGLQERANIANAAQATLFVSIHCNAINNADVKGTETFYEGTAADYDPESKLLAEAIQRALVKALGSKDRGAKTWYGQTLVVLAKSTMTGVLTEVGFLTNAEEEAKLLTADYQRTAARAIADGIIEYLEWPAGGR